jgi:hypothetical protein
VATDPSDALRICNRLLHTGLLRASQARSGSPGSPAKPTAPGESFKAGGLYCFADITTLEDGSS